MSKPASAKSARSGAKSAKTEKESIIKVPAIPLVDLKAEREKMLLTEHAEELEERYEADEEASEENRQRVELMFRQQLQQAKQPALIKEIEEIERDFNGAIGRKDALLALTARFTTASEGERRIAINAHSQTIVDLQALLDERFEEFEIEANDDIARLRSEYFAEQNALESVYSIRKTVLKQIICAEEAEEDDMIDQLKTEYTKRMNDAKNYNEEECNICKLNLEEQNTELERHLLEAHSNYKLETETKQHQFKILLLKDEESSHEIDKQKARIARLEKELVHWKTRIESTSEEFKEKNALLLEEKEECYKEFSELKQKLNGYRRGESERMKTLASAAHEAEDKIEALKEEADRIIRLAELCGRLETEAERINEIDRLEPEELREIEREAAELSARHESFRESGRENDSDITQPVEAETEIVEAVKELNHVHKKLSNATIDRLALEREQTLLDRENRELREALQRYLSLGIMAENAI